ncbi:MAG: coproporphyrinogen III oxidase family protein [Treponema sp.]|jgi:oxygen-independent coproporphyrinogen-3 oxidase|nr:coproporphyrinogen III oxidase family protein [Treponema sp.]
MEASLYLHIPFCAGSCDYCDFYSIPAEPADPRVDAYIDRLLVDTRQAVSGGVGAGSGDAVLSVPTVYIGGGTPSLLGRRRLERLLAGLAALMPNVPLEWTVEANPESADEAFFETCAATGVTRVSLGVQTFHEPSRVAVNRVGEARLLQERLELARSFFPDAFSVDLITGLPFQDEAVLQADIERTLAFEPAHVSLYSLTVDERAPLWKKWKTWEKARGFDCDMDRIDRLWLAGRDRLERNGYVQYEVSNFCRKGEMREASAKNMSAHNLRYWRMENWLGIGAAASGTIIDDKTGAGVRRTVAADVDAYLARPAVAVERLDRAAIVKETFLMGFRTMFGPDEALFRKRFHADIEAYIPKTIALWRNKGLFDQERLRLTSAGLLFLDAFLREAFRELDRGDDAEQGWGCQWRR